MRIAHALEGSLPCCWCRLRCTEFATKALRGIARAQTGRWSWTRTRGSFDCGWTSRLGAKSNPRSGWQN